MNANMIRVSINDLVVQPQVRTVMDEESLQGLAGSIAVSGLQQPLLVRREGTQLIVIDGHRRLAACKQLGMAEVDVLVVDRDIDAGEILTRQLVCNLQREDLSVLDRAEGIAALIGRASLTAEQVAKHLGLSPSTVSRTVSVISLPDDIKGLVASGEVSADAAYRLARIDDPVRQRVLAAQVASGQLSRDDLARKLKRLKRGEESRAQGRSSRVKAVLGHGRSVTIAGKDLTLEAAIEWVEQFLSGAKKAKSQGLTIETYVRAMKDQAASKGRRVSS